MGVVGVGVVVMVVVEERGVELLEAEQHAEKSLWLYQPALVFHVEFFLAKMHLNFLDIIKSMFVCPANV